MGEERRVSPERESLIGQTRSQRNRTKLEPKHTGEAYLGQEEGLFLEQGGEKRRLAEEPYSYRIGERQFLTVQSILGAIS